MTTMIPLELKYYELVKHQACEDGFLNLLLRQEIIGDDDRDLLDSCSTEEIYEYVGLEEKEFSFVDAIKETPIQDILWALCCFPEFDTLWRKLSIYMSFKTTQCKELKLLWDIAETGDLDSLVYDAKTSVKACEVFATVCISRFHFVTNPEILPIFIYNNTRFPDAKAYFDSDDFKQKLYDVISTRQCPCPWEE